MKKNYIASDSAVIAAIMAISLLISGIFTAVSSEKHIEESLVRLHILANSDSELDQQLKLRVRDAVLASSDELFEPYSSSEEAEEYGEYTVPAGRYTALRITIGEGKGHNWWCVMYPPLCVPCAGVDMTDEEIMEKYGGELTDEDIELLTEEGYKPRLYIAELIGGLLEK